MLLVADEFDEEVEKEAFLLLAYPPASGDAKCCSCEGESVLEQITNITAFGNRDDRLSVFLARIPTALWR
jgi:hypothetical protein